MLSRRLVTLTGIALASFALGMIAVAVPDGTIAVGPVIAPIAALLIALLAALIIAIVTALVRPRFITALVVTAWLIPVIAARVAAIVVALVAVIITVRIAGGKTGAVVFVEIATALAVLFRLLVAIIAEYTIIMVGILKVIFRRNAVAGLLGVAGQRAVLLKQLAGVAALPIVKPVAVVVAPGHLLRTRTIVAAAASPVLIIPDQLRVPV